MGQIYSSHIKVSGEFITFLKSIKFINKSVIDKELSGIQYSIFTREDHISLNLYYFHILIFHTKKQNHLFSHLDEDFFNNLSPYKDKLRVSFIHSDGTLLPISVQYDSQVNKTNITLKKNIIKLFNNNNIHIKESPTSKNKKGVKEAQTNFIFDQF